MSQADLDQVRKSVSATIAEINHRRAVLGDADIDDEDRMEATDILNRIERKLAAHRSAA